uniref:F-box domain-containing protein n=1 Tax=Salix viminalis TaxID=40686 RepID=A0A6N2NDG5_SALVM
MAETVDRDGGLPEDLLITILMALPAKCLVRFRSVSKYWNSLITSTEFINIHLAQAKPLLLFHHHNQSYSLRLDNESLDMWSNSEFELPSKREDDDFQIIGSCNGVICILNTLQDHGQSMILWNPSIGKSLNLVLPRLSDPFRGIFGFGFNRQSNDYKFVRVATPQYPVGCHVYSVKKRSWKAIDVSPALGCIKPIPSVLWGRSSSYNYAFLNGVLHWIVDREEFGSRFVLSFDLRNDSFGKVMLSPYLASKLDEWMSILVYDNSVSLFLNDLDTRCMKLWARKIRINARRIGGNGLYWQNGEILMTRYPSDEVVSCDPQSKEIRDLKKLGLSDYAGSFVESLALLDELKEPSFTSAVSSFKCFH